jgi:hypothetical protein
MQEIHGVNVNSNILTFEIVSVTSSGKRANETMQKNEIEELEAENIFGIISQSRVSMIISMLFYMFFEAIFLVH